MENSFKCPFRILVLESFLDIKQNALVIFSNPNSQCNGQSTEHSGCGEQSFPPPTAAVFSLHDGKFSRNHSFGKSVIILFVYSRMSLVFLSGQSTHANSMVSYVSSQYMCVFCSTSNMSHIKKKHHKTPHSNVCVSIFVQIFVKWNFHCQVKPVRLSSVEVGKVSFPTAVYKSPTNQEPASYDARNSQSYSSNLLSKRPVDWPEISERVFPEISERLFPKISERVFPEENLEKTELPQVHWVQDNARPPPRWVL